MAQRSQAHLANAAPLPCDALPLKDAGRGFQLLAGVRVVDLTTSVAGPSGTMLLADMGARSSRSSPSVGDDALSWGGRVSCGVAWGGPS